LNNDGNTILLIGIFIVYTILEPTIKPKITPRSPTIINLDIINDIIELDFAPN
tara:strand:- start:21 stop:179 length:159 start_codon:yes stop_codon:yes gene_type:complete